MKAAFAAIIAGIIALATPALAQDKLVAIDVLLEPDQRMVKAAEDWNARLREQMPEGFSLDATHRPPISRFCSNTPPRRISMRWSRQ
jgi:hypothetical protein